MGSDAEYRKRCILFKAVRCAYSRSRRRRRQFWCGPHIWTEKRDGQRDCAGIRCGSFMPQTFRRRRLQQGIHGRGDGAGGRRRQWKSAAVTARDPSCSDGYNIIFSWDELNELAKTNLDHARHRLIDILNNYQGYRKCLLIVVFDAYKIKKNIGSIEKNDNIYVVYTKEAQTADNYIEKVTHDLSQKYRVYVATSDALEQIIVSSRGAMRISAREFELLVKETHLHEIEEFQRKNKQMKNYLLEDLKKN